MRTDSMLSEPQTVEGTGTLQFRPPEGQAGQFAGVTITNLSGYPVLVSSSAQQVMVPAGITAPVPYDGSGQPVTVAAVAGSLGSPGPITARWYYVGSVMPAVAVPATTLDTGPADVNVTNGTLTVETSGTVDTNVTNSSLTVDASGSTIELASGTSVALDASTATIGTVELASGSSVDASISGPVTIETASGTPITATVQGSLTSITDPISVTGPVTVEGVSGGTTIGVAGTVDANITNATLTVETSGTTDVNVTNATVPVSGSVTATIDGPVGISGGTVNVIQPFTGETLPSAAGSTTTGNATLSATDYNLVSWDAVPLPAGSPGNLVYDSNLTNAIASVGPTWVGRAGYVPTIGTADGDMNVLNAGTDSAEWVYYGDGAQTGTLAVISQGVAVTPGATYTLSARMDATNMTAGTMQVQLYNSSPDPATAYLVLGQSLGGNGRISGQVTIPAGVTTVYPGCQLVNPSVTAGDTISWSQIQLTETSTAQPYEPGPLWEYPVYGRGGLLGETTKLAFEDTGQTPNTDFQPPTVNTSYPQLSAPSTPTVTPEGTTGSTTYDYQVTAKTPGTAAGATRLMPSPGTNIGTIDIGSGNKVEIAAGTAQIGTVDIASGATIALDAGTAEIGTVDLASGATVDANITNATLDITGPVTIAAATQSGSTFGTVNASAQDSVNVTVAVSSSGVTVIPAPSSTQHLQLFLVTYVGNDPLLSLATSGGVAVGPQNLTPPSTSLPTWNGEGVILPAGEGLNASNGSSTNPGQIIVNYAVIG